jgi:hypothetical protein
MITVHPSPPFFAPLYWNELPTEEKITSLHRFALASWEAGQTMSATVENLRQRLARIEAKLADRAS